MQYKMKVVVRGVAHGDESALRKLLAELGIHPSSIHKVFSNAPTGRTGKTIVSLPKECTIVVYVEDNTTAEKLVEAIQEEIDKECITVAV